MRSSMSWMRSWPQSGCASFIIRIARRVGSGSRLPDVPLRCPSRAAGPCSSKRLRQPYRVVGVTPTSAAKSVADRLLLIHESSSKSRCSPVKPATRTSSADTVRAVRAVRRADLRGALRRGPLAAPRPLRSSPATLSPTPRSSAGASSPRSRLSLSSIARPFSGQGPAQGRDRYQHPFPVVSRTRLRRGRQRCRAEPT